MLFRSAVCSCGKYQSREYAAPRYAESAARRHLRARLSATTTTVEAEKSSTPGGAGRAGATSDLASARSSAQRLVQRGDHLLVSGDRDGARAEYQRALATGDRHWAPYAARRLEGLQREQDAERARRLWQ